MELLTVLIPSSIDLEPTSHRTDRNGLTAALVSAAMAGADPIGVNMLKSSIAGDTVAQKALRGQFYAVVCVLCQKNGWRFRESEKKPVRLLKMAEMAAIDLIQRTPCPKCKGAGHNLDNPSEICPKCEGVGSYRLTGRHYAKYLEINESTWRGTWQQRYNDLLMVLQEREYNAKRYIRRKLLDA